MMSFMALEGVTLFLRLKDVTNATWSKYWAGVFQCKGGKLEEAGDFNFFSSFIVH